MALSRRAFCSVSATGWLLRARAAQAAKTAIAGGGSSFSKTIVQAWIDALPGALDLEASYKVMGTGVAQTRILSSDIDFAAVELPMSDQMLGNGQILQFPVACGALACVVNLPGLAADELRLNGVLLAGIYGGTIRSWSDPRIAAANPGLTLPDLPIMPLRLDLPVARQSR
jgi:phosphate transport system substrate-binding protein